MVGLGRTPCQLYAVKVTCVVQYRDLCTMGFFYGYETIAVILLYAYIYLMIAQLCLRERDLSDPSDPSDDPDKWVIIGYYDGKTLYEQTYASGKKAWRFKEDGEYVYPRKREVNKNVTRWPVTSD